MTDDEIAAVLTDACEQLTSEARKPGAFTSSKEFEDRVRSVVRAQLRKHHKKIGEFAAQDFPDIVIGDWGIEVKHTKDDKWRTVANSVFEGHRKDEVDRVFLLYAKMGGTPEVRWARYEDAVIHVRTSHRPRYEVDVEAKTTLFSVMGIAYADFRKLDENGKMAHIRKYARSRLEHGEQLWWLGDAENPHSLPITARLYIKLPQHEKARLRAEAAFLCPEIVKTSRGKNKYNRVALYLLTYHGVVASQARDLFSAGSVAVPGNKGRGGNYVLRALKNLEGEMIEVASSIDPELLASYWGKPAPKSTKGRIAHWLKLADEHAGKAWTPSKHLFQEMLG